MSDKIFLEIITKATKIKEDFCRAYLASYVNENTTVEDMNKLIKSIEMVQQSDMTNFRWYFRPREDDND